MAGASLGSGSHVPLRALPLYSERTLRNLRAGRMILTVVQNVRLVRAVCDGCGLRKGPYAVETNAVGKEELPEGWITKPHWGYHYLTTMHLCPACAGKETK